MSASSVPVPAWAQDARRLLGSRPCVLVLLALRSSHAGAMAQQELVKATGLLPATLSLALRELEDLGVAVASVERPLRRGRPVSWSLNQTRLDEIVAAIATHLHSAHAIT